MQISSLSDEFLWTEVGSLVQAGRKVDVSLLHHLAEVERRRLYADRGYSNMWDFLTRGQKFSKASAQRRIDTIHLMKTYPELATKLEDGSLSMSVAAMAYRCFKNNALSPEQKSKLLRDLENKSEREAEKEICKLVPKPHPSDSDKPLDDVNSLLSIVVDEETRLALLKLKACFSHSHSNMSFGDLIKILAKDGLKKYDRAREPQHKRSEVPVAEPESVVMPTAETERALWKRDGSQCTFVDERTRVRCSATHFLQVDHILSRALGGTNELSNLRLRCQAHNLLHAYQIFGPKKMDQFVKR